MVAVVATEGSRLVYLGPVSVRPCVRACVRHVVPFFRRGRLGPKTHGDPHFLFRIRIQRQKLGGGHRAPIAE